MMELHPDCIERCQQAVDYGVWPAHSCNPKCVLLDSKPKSGCGCAPEGDGTDLKCPNPLTGRLLCDPDEPGCAKCGCTEPIHMKPCIYCGEPIPEDRDQEKPSDYCHHG